MSGPFASLKVVEVGEMASAPYAGKLLADLGAEVIKVELPEQGDPGAPSRPVSQKSSPIPKRAGCSFTSTPTSWA